MPVMAPIVRDDDDVHWSSTTDGLRQDVIGHLVAQYYYEELQACYAGIAMTMAEDGVWARRQDSGHACLMEGRRRE